MNIPNDVLKIMEEIMSDTREGQIHSLTFDDNETYRKAYNELISRGFMHEPGNSLRLTQLGMQVLDKGGISAYITTERQNENESVRIKELEKRVLEINERLGKLNIEKEQNWPWRAVVAGFLSGVGGALLVMLLDLAEWIGK